MAKMKVYDIAKSLNTKSTELVKLLNENGFDVKSHNSNIEDNAIAFILKHFAPKKETAKPEKPQAVKKREEEVKKEAKPLHGEAELSQKQEPASVAKQVPPSETSTSETTVSKSENRERTEEKKTEKPMNEKKTLEKDAVQTAQKPNTNTNAAPVNNPNGNGNSNEKRFNNRESRPGNVNRNNNNRSYDNRNNNSSNDNRNSDNRNNDNRNNNSGNNYRNSNRSYDNRTSDNRSSNTGNDNRNSDNRNNTGGNNYRGNSDNRNTGSRPNNYRGNNGNSDNRNSNGGNNYRGNNDNRSYDNRNNNSDNRNSNTNGNSSTNGNGGNRTNDNRGSNFRSGDNRNGQNGPNRGTGRPGGNYGTGGYNNNRGTGRPGDNRQQAGNRTQGNGGRQRNDFEKSISALEAPVEKTQRKTDKAKRGNSSDRNRNSRYREKDIALLKQKKDPNRKGAFIKPEPVAPKEPDDGIKTILIPESITLRDLADKMKQPAANIIKKFFLQGKMYSINQEIEFEEAEEIALEYNCIVELEEQVDVIEELLKEDEEDESAMVKRPPVVCVMGHVDHGKTSLLDAVRETHVTDREAGGITQHIGAYMVEVNGEKITFLDTPGHEAFTSMRMRGAKSTDIAILVVAADDGVMPQTVEAINHAKAAEVEIIVAINKIDKPGANIERVKQELSEYELIPEDWGGSTVFVPVSAKTGEGLDQLLEMIILTAEVLELKANPARLGRGIVIEAQLDKGRGPVATILVQKGTLHVGDAVVIGSAHGKVRAMIDDKGRRVKDARPSTPVEILGLNEVPDAGEIFMATESEKEAKNIASAYIKQGREKLLADTKAKLSLDGLFSQIQAGNIKELNLIVKADVQGSVEAVKQSLLKLSNEEVAIRIIHGGVGAVTESDVNLAVASNAIIIGFNVRPDPMAKELVEREKVDLRLYKVIYSAIEDIEAAMKGMLDPVFEEKIIGHAEIRQVFKASKLGNIAGSYVLDGKIVRDSKVRITREDKLIFEGELASLKRFKDDVKEVASGYECGLVFDKFDDVKEEDKVEVYIMEEVPR